MTGPATHESLWSPRLRSLTLGLVLTITVVAAESLAIAAAMPIVAKDLGGRDLYGWVFSAFFLGQLVGIAVVGGLIDERGPVVPFVGGLVLFGIGLVVGGLAPSMPVLVAARLVQGLGGGAVGPVAYVAIGRDLPGSLRPRMFALLSAAWVVPGVLGPGVAGLVAEALHWRFVFLGLVPLLVVAGAIATKALGDAERAAPVDRSERQFPPGTQRRRLAAAVSVAAGGGLATAGLQASEPLAVVGMTAAGLALAAVALRRLTPPGTLTLRRGYPAAIILRGLLTFSFYAIDPYVPLLLVDVRGWSAAASGVVISATTVMWSLGAWLQSRGSGRTAPERFVRIGFPIVALGVAGIALGLVPEVPAIASGIAFAFGALGMGLAYSQFAIVVLRDAPEESHGSASAALSLADALGTALGAGLTNAIVAAAVRAGPTRIAGDTTGLAVAIAVAVSAAALGWALTPRLVRAAGGAAHVR